MQFSQVNSACKTFVLPTSLGVLNLMAKGGYNFAQEGAWMTLVKPLQKEDERRWDDFVDASENGTIFHKIAWKRILEKTFRYRSCYFFAEKDGRICGVLPLFHVRSMFAGNAIISTPFAVYGGILADDAVAESALLEACKDRALQLGVTYVELRQRFRCRNPGLQTRDSLYCTFIKPIHAEAEKTFAALPREARRMVRKAEKFGLTAKFAEEGLSDFYEIYATSVHYLGTPVFPRRLFESCLRELKPNADLLLISHQDQPVAGVLSFYYRDAVLPYYGGSFPDKNHLAPNNFMYWALMKSAGERGYRFFDFGRSKNATGAFDFKRHMGFEPLPLPYQYWMMNGAPIPNNNPTNPKFQLAIKVWQRMPLSLTKVLGPRLVRAFP
jgi:FemAB-related protein (PEP-CTERM system-associated)